MPTNIFDAKVKPSLPADDRIFLGEGLFETIRIERRQPCYYKLHWQRMSHAAMLLGIPFELSSPSWYEQLIHCIQVHQVYDGGLKVILSGGSAPRGLDEHGKISSLIFQAFTYTHHRHALRLVSAPWLRDANNPIYKLKSVNYLESIVARRHALSCGADDALFFNLDHNATETTAANLFVVKNERVVTPLLEDGLLDGITRGRILSLCMSAGINCEEASLNSNMLMEADAVFVTNALQGIRSVKSFNENQIPTHHPFVTLLQHLLASDEERLV